MNVSARKHLDKAADYVAKGEEFYRKAAEEIIAAKEADPTLTQQEIGEQIGYDNRRVSEILKWARSGAPGTPWAGTGREKAAIHARTILREAPLEQVEQIVAELPPERKAIVARATMNVRYRQARKEYEQEEANLTPLQKKEREAAQQAITRPAKKAISYFGAMAAANCLEQATEHVREAVGEGELSAEAMAPIRSALLDFLVEYNVAAAMAGLDDELIEVQS